MRLILFSLGLISFTFGEIIASSDLKLKSDVISENNNLIPSD